MYVRACAEQGVPFWGLTVQNEPESIQRFESCVYSPEEERDFIKLYLGPTVRAAHPEVKLLAWDHNRDHVNIWADVIYADEDASQYVWGLGMDARAPAAADSSKAKWRARSCNGGC